MKMNRKRNPGNLKFFLSTGTLCIWLIFTTFGCKEKGEILTEHFSLNIDHRIVPVVENSVIQPIDVSKSRIVWRGTKLGGMRGHEGILEFEEGHLLLHQDSILGGRFIANMQSLQVTDIPDNQPIAKNNLKNHLKSEFKTEKFPQSSFVITNVKYSEPGILQVLGKLQIMGIEKSISASFILAETTSQKKLMTTNIKLNRKEWKIGEEAGWLEKRVVDKDFNLEITIAY